MQDILFMIGQYENITYFKRAYFYGMYINYQNEGFIIRNCRSKCLLREIK